MHFVAACDGLRGADRRTAAAVGAEVGVARGQVDDGIFLLPAAVAQHEADEAQHRPQRGPHLFQLGGVDRREVPGVELFAHRGAERRGLSEVLCVGASCGDGGLGGAVGVFPDECRGGHRDESLPGGQFGQFGGGVLEGPVAVDRNDDGRGAFAPERFEPFYGRRGDVSPIDRCGDHGHRIGRERCGLSGGVGQVEGFQRGGFGRIGSGRGDDSPGHGRGDLFRGSRRRKDDGMDGLGFHVRCVLGRTKIRKFPGFGTRSCRFGLEGLYLETQLQTTDYEDQNL